MTGKHHVPDDGLTASGPVAGFVYGYNDLLWGGLGELDLEHARKTVARQPFSDPPMRVYALVEVPPSHTEWHEQRAVTAPHVHSAAVEVPRCEQFSPPGASARYAGRCELAAGHDSKWHERRVTRGQWQSLLRWNDLSAWAVSSTMRH